MSARHSGAPKTRWHGRCSRVRSGPAGAAPSTSSPSKTCIPSCTCHPATGRNHSGCWNKFLWHKNNTRLDYGRPFDRNLNVAAVNVPASEWWPQNDAGVLRKRFVHSKEVSIERPSDRQYLYHYGSRGRTVLPSAPALADVGAPGLLAHRVQVQRAELFLQFAEVLPRGYGGLQPGRQPQPLALAPGPLELPVVVLPFGDVVVVGNRVACG